MKKIALILSAVLILASGVAGCRERAPKPHAGMAAYLQVANEKRCDFPFVSDAVRVYLDNDYLGKVEYERTAVFAVRPGVRRVEIKGSCVDTSFHVTFVVDKTEYVTLD
jgi:hypothetical protein